MNIKRKLVRATIVGLALLPMNSHAVVERAPAPESWPRNLESLIAFGVLVTAVLMAWSLNHARPKMRAFGSFLAALSCFGIVLWFVGAISTGFIENPKEFQTPMDAAKPVLLWLQIITALIGGVMLLAIANKQRKQSEWLDLPNTNEAGRYGRVSRILHGPRLSYSFL